jgi:Flp pilus assembly protein TadD
MAEDRGPARWPKLLAAVFLACLVGAVFFRIPGFGFVNLDVPGQVLDNPHIRGLSVENLKHVFTSRCVTSYYPFRTLTFMVDYQLWGLDPVSRKSGSGRPLSINGFKLTNLLIHLTNVFLVYGLILRLLTDSDATESPAAPWWGTLVAAFSAGIFAVHPVVVEPVTWVAGREELLMTLGALGCFHFHITARRLEAIGGRTLLVVACFIGALFCCALACLSNAVAAVIPLLITAWDLVMLARPKLWKIVYGTGALWVIGIVTIVLKRLGEADGSYLPEFGVLSAQRWMVVLNVYWLNWRTVVWPEHLAVDYRNVVPQRFTELEVVLGGLALGLTCVALWMFRRRKLAVFGLVWFVLALGPTSQILPHHLDRADRFLYLPLVGLALAVAVGLRPLAGVVKGPPAVASAIAVGVCGLVLLGMRSADQVQVWRDSVSLWENCVRCKPDNAYAHSCLAGTLADAGRFEEAVSHFETALQMAPDDPRTLDSYAFRLAACRQEHLRDYDQAIRLARQACRLSQWKDPKFRRTLATAYMNLGTVQKRDGQFHGAIHNYRNAIAADPDYEAPRFNLALLLATCPDPKLRDPDEAVRLAEEACTLGEGPNAVTLTVLAQVYAAAGRFDRAAAATERAIQRARAANDSEILGDLRRRLTSYRKQIGS